MYCTIYILKCIILTIVKQLAPHPPPDNPGKAYYN